MLIGFRLSLYSNPYIIHYIYSFLSLKSRILPYFLNRQIVLAMHHLVTIFSLRLNIIPYLGLEVKNNFSIISKMFRYFGSKNSTIYYLNPRNQVIDVLLSSKVYHFIWGINWVILSYSNFRKFDLNKN